jgi:hypothetical protein
VNGAGTGTSLLALKERKREMDDLWLLAMVVLLLAVGVLWFQRILDIELARVLWTALSYGAAYVVVGLLADRVATPGVFLGTVAALQVTGVAMLTILWRLCGGLQNPMLLFVFVLPIITGSLVLPRWQVYGTAALTVLAVTTVAFVDNAALRWYVLQLDLPLNQPVEWLGRLPASTVHPFPVAAESPSYLAAIVFLFAVTMLAVAGVADGLGRLTARLQSRSAALTDALTNVESLSAQTLRRLPLPTALVYADTFRVIAASDSLYRQYLMDADGPPRTLFELVHFSYPEAVEGLIAGGGGELPLVAVAVNHEKRFVRVRVSCIVHEHTTYACIALQDETDLQHLRLAVDALDEALIVVGRGRILAFNASAARVVDRLAPGADAAGPLSAANLPFAWWSLGVRRHETFDVQLGQRTFQASCHATRVEGEADSLTVITLEPKGAGR